MLCNSCDPSKIANISQAIKGHNKIFEIVLPIHNPMNVNINIGIKVHNGHILLLSQPYMIIQDARVNIIPMYITYESIFSVFLDKNALTILVFDSVCLMVNKKEIPNIINSIVQTIPNIHDGGLNITSEPAFFLILHMKEEPKQTISGEINIKKSL